MSKAVIHNVISFIIARKGQKLIETTQNYIMNDINDKSLSMSKSATEQLC